MRWVIKRMRWHKDYSQGVKNKTVFTVQLNNNTNKFYFMAIKEGEFTFNSLWYDLEFITEDDAKAFCEKFNYENYKNK